MMSDEEKQVEVPMEKILFQVDESDSIDIHRAIGVLLSSWGVPVRPGNMIGRAVADICRRWEEMLNHAAAKEAEKLKGLEWARVIKGHLRKMCGKDAYIREKASHETCLDVPGDGSTRHYFECQSIDHAKRCAALYEPFLQELLKGGE